MKKFLSIFITVIMSLTMFSSVTSLADNSVQAPQSNLQKSEPYFKNNMPNWFLITNYTTAKDKLKNKPDILNQCSPEFFLKYKIYVLSFSINSAATVTYAEPFKYNVYYPEYLCKCLTIYTDYLLVDKDVNFNGTIKFNETHYSGEQETTWLYPEKIYVTPDQVPKIKTATNLKAKSYKKKTIKVSWKKVKNATGYIVKISPNKKFNFAKTKRYAVKKNSITIKKLKRKKKYYVKVKAYQNVILNGKRVNVYGKEWSKIKSVKIK